MQAPKKDTRPKLPYLYARRMKAMMSQREYAQTLGIAASTLNRIEQGEPVNYVTVRKIAKALTISTDQLLKEDPTETSS
jgi:transcriptional regulator with XRE-family HTH domain